MIDLAIIGSGPAALSAALYAARAGLSVQIYEKNSSGGALNQITQLANYPGSTTTKGAELAQRMLQQATQAGAQFSYATCSKIRQVNHPVASLQLTVDNQTVSARSVLIATGSEPRRLSVATQTPIYSCAVCDGPLHPAKRLIVVGGGNSALHEALTLSKLAQQVSVYAAHDFSAEVALLQQAEQTPNISLHSNHPVDTALLDSADAIFVAIGRQPATNFLPAQLLDSAGYVKTDAQLMTTIPGLFAAGDVRRGAVKQIITAAAEGSIAALNICNFLRKP